MIKFIFKLIAFAIACFTLAVIVNFGVWCFRPEPAFFKDTFQTVLAIIIILGLLRWVFKKSD